MFESHMLSRWVLSELLNRSSEFAFLTCVGSQYQSLGAVYANDLWPYVTTVFMVLCSRVVAAFDWRVKKKTRSSGKNFLSIYVSERLFDFLNWAMVIRGDSHVPYMLMISYNLIFRSCKKRTRLLSQLASVLGTLSLKWLHGDWVLIHLVSHFNGGFFFLFFFYILVRDKIHTVEALSSRI